MCFYKAKIMEDHHACHLSLSLPASMIKHSSVCGHLVAAQFKYSCLLDGIDFSQMEIDIKLFRYSSTYLILHIIHMKI